MKKETFRIGDQEYTVEEYIEHAGWAIPLVAIPMGTDYQWQLMALKRRLRHPIRYTKLGENVLVEIFHLICWLIRHRHDR